LQGHLENLRKNAIGGVFLGVAGAACTADLAGSWFTSLVGRFGKGDQAGSVGFAVIRRRRKAREDVQTQTKTIKKNRAVC
jgi:hypothetical protein